MGKDLLVEIGTEELPASFVAGALAAMPRIVNELLDGLRLSHGEASAYGSPRRIAVLVRDVAERQRDVSEEVVGPPKAAAFEADGKPKKGLEGFAKKLGVPVERVYLKTTDKGEYAAAMREEKGLDASSVLPAMIGQLCAAIPFAKSMRWGAGDVAFGRPVHWIIALHGDAIVGGEFAGVKTGRSTRGHRFLAPASIDVADASRYLEALRAVHVLADEGERRAAMQKALEEAALSIGGELVKDDFLVGENASLVEKPHVVAGSFDAAFLELPDEVIVAVMRGHQRYFAVRAPGAERLLPRYLAVVNTARDPETIARGNDRVLRARLADARFFVTEDRKKRLEERVSRLDGIVFQAKLGTVGEKVARITELAASLAGQSADTTRRAALLAKTDLVSLIVGEFPELQGLMGRWYALEDGESARVADAIRDHYLPKSAGDALPRTVESVCVALADRVDTLVGCFSIGLVPSGSADPYALRRAALAIVRIVLDSGQFEADLDLHRLFAAAHAEYVKQGKGVGEAGAVVAKLDEFVRARLRAYLGERHPADVVEACLGPWDGRSLRDLGRRIEGLSRMRALPEFESLATSFKRAHNIAKDVAPGAIDRALFAKDAEHALADAWGECRGAIERAVQSGDYAGALSTVARELGAPIGRYFDDVLVMDPDERVRANRLRLLSEIARTLSGIAHFHALGA